MARYQAVRGTFDILPSQISVWQRLEQESREIAQRFGYHEIRTPLFEEADLFTRGMGVMAGLIEKELWTFQDKFGQKLALRTDVTTGIIRAFQQNKLYQARLPVKVFYLAPVFLLGKDEESRSRQSHQFGFEAIGCSSPALDAEVIALAVNFCEEIGLEDVEVRLNSLGGKECRPPYLQKLKDYFSSNSSDLCGTCKRKFKANPDWVLSCDEAGCKELAQVAPTIFGMLSTDAKSHFSQLREYLKEMELPVELDPRVVRDTEYYNSTVFEIRCQGKSLGFGGRYDTLVEKIGGKATPAVGFAFCLESLLDLLPGAETKHQASVDVLLRPEGPESAKLLVPLLFTLRKRGVTAELDYSQQGGRRSKNTLNYSYLVTLDESNAFRGNAIVKDLEDKSDEKVPVSRLRNRVLHIAGVSADGERDGSKSGRKRLKRGRRRSEEETKEQDSESSGRGKKGRKSRRSEKAKSNRSRERDKDRVEEESLSEETDKKERAPRSKKRAPRKERGGGDTKSKKSTKDTPAEGGKAIVPVFALGIGSSAEPPVKAPPKKTAVTKKKSTPSAAGGSLNWSIIPEKKEG